MSYDYSKSLWKTNFDFSQCYSDEWRARCLGDYFQSVANDTAKIEQLIEDSTFDEPIENIITPIKTELCQFRMLFNKWLSANQQLFSIPVTSIAYGTLEYQDAILSYLDSSEGSDFYTNYLVHTFRGLSKEDFAWFMSRGLEDRMIYEETVYQGLLNTRVNNLLYIGGYTDGYVSLTCGNIKLSDLLKRYLTEVNLDVSYLSGYEGWSFVDETGNPVNDDALREKGVNIEYIKSEISALSASMSLWATAITSCVKESISDRINIVNSAADNILSTLTDTYESTKRKFDLMRSKVSQVISDTRTNINNVVDTLNSIFAVDEIYQTGEVLDKTDLAQYTGLNPTSALRFKGLGKVLGATVTICAEAGKAAWNLIKKVASKIYSKIRPWINALLGNPEDLKVIDNEAESYETDLFCYNKQGVVLHFSVSDSQTWFGAGYLQKYKGKWIRTTNLVGTKLYKITDISHDFGNIYVTYDYRFKPKCVNVQTFHDAGLAPLSAYDVSDPITPISDVKTYMETIYEMSKSSRFYADNDTDEGSYQFGFIYALFADYVLSLGSAILMSNHDPDYSGVIECPNTFWLNDCGTNIGNVVPSVNLLGDPNIVFGNAYQVNNSVYFNGWQGTWQDPSVTNVTFINTVSGCYSPLHNQYYAYDKLPAISPVMNTFAAIQDSDESWRYPEATATDWNMNPGLIVLMNVLVNNEKYVLLQQEDPTFIPFSTLTNDFDSPRFAVRTDAENIKMCTQLASVLVTVAVIAIAYFTTKGLISAVKTKRLASIKTKVGQIDSAMWSGQKPNLIAMTFYNRWNRKLSKAGLTGTMTSVSSNALFSQILSQLNPTDSLASSSLSNNQTDAAANTPVLTTPVYAQRIYEVVTGDLNLRNID